MSLDRMPERVAGRLRERARDQHGVSLVLVAGAAVALFSIVALAVDYGMLTSARTEAQRVADLSALAGAGWLAVLPGDEDGARSEAIQYAARNTIRGTAADVRPEDVVVDLDAHTVRVTVYRIAERGNAVATWFARVFGVDAVDVSAYAVAEAYDADHDDGVGCLLPIAQQDRWQEGGPGGPFPEEDDTFDPDTDYYDREATGWSNADVGETIYIRSATGGGGDINPSWYFPWTPAGEEAQLDGGGPGGDRYRDRFTTCLHGIFEPGTTVMTEPGAMVGPTNQGFDELIDLDPDMAWDEAQDCPVRTTGEDAGACVTASWRIRPMPLFDPRFPPDNGRSEFVISNFVNVYVEGKQGNRFYGRILGVIGVAGDGNGNGGGAVDGSIVRLIRLIE